MRAKISNIFLPCSYTKQVALVVTDKVGLKTILRWWIIL